MPGTNRQLDGALAALLARRESHGKLRRLTKPLAHCVDFSSNGYLSLSTNLEIQEQLLARLQARVAAGAADIDRAAGSRASILGSGGSRLLDGNSSFAEEIEARIAAFHRSETALLFTSAYDANTGLLGSVPQPGDVIVYDELIHASVHDGMRMSRAGRKIPFAHNSVSGSRPGAGAEAGDGRLGRQSENKNLEHVLGQLSGREGSEDVRSGKANVFVCVEGLYSMDGDVVHLQKVVDAVDRCLPSGNGYIIVDEAHSVGVFGDDGRGLVCKSGLEDRIWARVLGFGKAIGCSGGVVLCSSTVRSYLINYARSLIYTTSMPFTSLASIEVVYDYLVSGRSKPLREHLEELIHYTHCQLRAICARQRPGQLMIRVQEAPAVSPIIPVLTPYPRALAEHCQRSGFMVRPIVAPTVPAGSERIRVCVHSGNTIEQVDGLCKAIEAWVRQNHGAVERDERRDKSKGLGEVTKTHNVLSQDRPRL
ncbi:PLP-dependent transferase [Durotheca rogersii]|uniref:PLP-dependent transferase n=1 Tax=Durotheca rogersii TaxID=419775 RepID=UPI00221EC4AE|nr:PLP-dependent transferase [Durotheca rogersii]KAI5866168.1 PLP-dependent transferase [Durotheca rogersii]